MRTYYKRNNSDDSNQTIGEVRYYDVCSKEKAEWFEDDCFLSGDYVGNGVLARANVQAIREEFSELEDVVFFIRRGSHGSEWVRFDISIQSMEDLDENGKPWELDTFEDLKVRLREVLDNLSKNPVIDSDLLSHMEMEEEKAAWKDYGERDFIQTLHQIAPHHGTDFFRVIVSSCGFNLWRELCQQFNINGGGSCVHEQGGVMFPFDDLSDCKIRAYDNEDCDSQGNPRMYWRDLEWADIRETVLDCLSLYRDQVYNAG